MSGQRQLHQDAVDGGIAVEALDEVEKFLLRCGFRQIVLHGMEAAFLGLAAFGSHVNLARRIFADDHHGNARNHAGRGHQLFGFGLHRGNHILGELLAINQLSHSERSVLSRYRA